MAKGDYIPNGLDALDTWLTTFFDNIDGVGVTLAQDPGIVASIKNKAQEIRTAYAFQKVKENERNSSVDTTQALIKTNISETGGIRKFVAQLKTNSAYTEALGDLIGIEGQESILDLPNLKPVLTISLLGGQIDIGYKKKGTSGINVYCKRGTETVFTFLGRDTDSPFPDNRANETPGKPEKREYYAFYIDGDVQIGLQSDTVSVTV